MNSIYQGLIEWHLKEANRLQNKGAGSSRNSLKLFPVPEGDCCLVRNKGSIFLANRKGRNYSTADMICISNIDRDSFKKDAPSGILNLNSDKFLIKKYYKWNSFMNEKFQYLLEKYYG